MSPSEAHSVDEIPDLVAAVPTAPESWTTFRLARLLLFLDVATSQGRPAPTVDRLGYYEFFADNPFIVVQGDRPVDEADRIELELLGFSPVQLAYASSGQRFVSRRQRLQHDLALLVARDLVVLAQDGFRVTTRGAELAQQLNSVYADAYRSSAAIVLRRLWSLSGIALDNVARGWLGESWLLIDLLDDISGTETPSGDSSPTDEGEGADQ